MIIIRQIKEDEYQKIVDWNKDKNEEYLFQWAGHKIYQFPITVEQIKTRNIDETSRIYTIYNDDEIIGSIELDKINLSTFSANICRFILCDKFKNKGLGSLALKELINIAFSQMNLNILTLGVFCFNISAMRCYEKCGFLVKEYYQRENPK